MNKLKKYIEENGLSCREVGKRIGISGQAVINLINNKNILNIKLRTYLSIKNNLGVDLLENDNETN